MKITTDDLEVGATEALPPLVDRLGDRLPYLDEEERRAVLAALVDAYTAGARFAAVAYAAQSVAEGYAAPLDMQITPADRGPNEKDTA